MPFTDAQIKVLSAKLSAKHVKTRKNAGPNFPTSKASHFPVTKRLTPCWSLS